MATNPYDELLGADPAQPASAPANPYMDLLDNVEQNRQRQLTAATTLATGPGLSPDAFAKARNSAKALGLPAGVADAIPEEVQQQARLKQVQQDASTSPTLQQRYTDADFAKLAIDDSGVLSSIGSGMRYLFSADSDRGLVNDLQAGYYGATSGTAGVFRAVADVAAKPFDFLEGATAIGGNPLRRLAEGFAQIAREGQAYQQAAGSKLSPDAGNFERGITSGVQSFSQNAIMLPAALMTGGESAALIGMAGQQGGASYQKAREQGVGQWQSLAYGLSDAVVEYATEKLPLHNLIGGVKAGAPVLTTFLKTAAAEVPGEQIATVLQDMNEWATLNPEKPFSAYLAERPSAAAQTLVATLVGTGGNVTISHAMQNVADNAMNVQRAQTAGVGLQQLLALSAQSKLRERSPDVFSATVQEMAADTGAPQAVRFDARTLADSLSQSGVDVATVFPSLSDQMQEALLTGGEVAIPIGEFAANVIGTPLEQTLQQHARLGENELSQAEAQEAGKQAEQYMQEQAQRVVEQGAQAGQEQMSADSVRTHVLDQLTAANRFTAPVNEAYATLAASFYQTMAQRLGTTADDLFVSYPLNVQAGVEEGAQLSQGAVDTPEFKAWFSDSKVTDSAGKPLVVYHGTAGDFDSFAYGDEVHFTTSPELASDFADLRARGEPGAKILPVYLSLKNPKLANSPPGSDDIREAKQHGYDGFEVSGTARGRHFVVFRPEQIKSAIGNRGTFDPNDPSILNQGTRGTYTPSTLTISLLEKADLSTFLHELGHHFLELMTDMAAQENAPPTVVKDMNTLLEWFGVKGGESRSPERTVKLRSGETVNLKYDDELGEIIATANGERIGDANFEQQRDTPAMVGGVDVEEAWQRKGVSSAMHDFLRDMHGGEIESNVLTPDGRAFWDARNKNTPASYTVVDEKSATSPLETWQAMPFQDRVAAHEKFAESFEQYLLEGKAPSAELTPVFQRFRAWMLNVYKSLSNFMTSRGTQLSDEVRQVFNRLIATDNEIRQKEEERNFAALFKSAEQAGMTPAEWAEYQAKGEGATQEAITQLQKRSLRDMRYLTGARSRALKALQKDAAGKRKAIETEVAAEVAKQPVYQAMRWLRKGEMTTEDGETIKADKGFRLNTDALAEMYPASGLGNPELDRLKGMTAKNGMHPDLIAPMFGFESGDQLVRALADAQPQNAVVEGMTDQRVLETYGDLGTEAGIERAADEAVHNEARGRFVATELRALREGQGSVSVMVRAAKDFAANLIARRKVRDLRAGQATQAEGRAARAAEKALLAGKTEEAIVAKRDQMLNHYIAREAMRTQDEIERSLAYLKKFDGKNVRTKLPGEYLDQIDKLLERVDLRAVTNREADQRAKLSAWIKSQEELGIEPEIPDQLLEDAQLVPYREMTVEAFRGLVDTVKQIEHLGRLKTKLLTAKDQRDFDAIRDDIVSTVLQNAGSRRADTRTPTTNWGRALQTVRNFGAAHIKAASWARILDGGKDGGTMWERFIRPANERADQETTMRAQATQDLTEIMAPILKQKNGGSGTYFPSIGRTMNREAVLAVALNTGNASNLQRLLGGEGWTEDQLKPVLSSLSAADWHAVQAIWDYFESYRPKIGEMERRIFGREPAWIEPREQAVTTSDGESLVVRGGYYPIKYDPSASVKAEQHADAESAKRQLQNAYSAATVRKGFTKGRVDEVNDRPLLYTLKGVYDGINDVIHYLSWQEWLIDMNRLLRNQKIDTAIRSTYGPAAIKQLRTWRDAVAEGESGSKETLDEALGVLRQSVGVAGLGFNVMSALMQPLGYTQSIVRIGAKYAGRGLVQYVAAPIKATKEVNEKSEFMAGRARTRFRELNELRNKVRGQAGYQEYVGRYAYWAMMRAQQAVDVPTWLGGYEKAIAEGNDEERAIDLADQAVKDSQGGGQTLDLSEIERGGKWTKLFTVFYSFMNTALNLGVVSKMTPGSKGKFAADMLLLYTVPAVLGALLKDALTPGDAGDGDPDKLLKKLAGEQLSFLLGLAVVGREFSDAGKWLMSGERPTDYRGPAGLRAITDAYQFAKQAKQGQFDDGFRKASINLLGDALGLPSAQINRTITGAKALKEGKTKNPAALVLGFQEPH